MAIAGDNPTADGAISELEYLAMRVDVVQDQGRIAGTKWFTERDLETLEWCWRGLLRPGQGQHVTRLCRSVLLWAYGARPEPSLHPENCQRWAFVGLPDDAWVRNEITGRFREGFIGSRWWPPVLRARGGLFWDVGAGSSAELLRTTVLAWRPRHVHLFEPVPKHYAELQERWQRRGYRNLTLHNFGLGSRTQRAAPLVLSGGSSSTFQELHFSAKRMYLDSVSDGQWRKARERVSVEIRSVQQVWRDLGVDTLALLSMNCEGCEFEVLPALAAAGLLARVGTVLVQLHPILTEEEARVCDSVTGTCPVEAAFFAVDRYCNLSAVMERTHRRAFGLPFNAFVLWELVSERGAGGEGR